jgi:excisionase family DNA binding protein
MIPSRPFLGRLFFWPQRKASPDPRRQSMKITGSINEAVDATGLSRSTLYQKIREGRLETIKFGGRTLVKWDSLKAMLEAA